MDHLTQRLIEIWSKIQKISNIQPIFLHSSWRTGGTALRKAFSAAEGVTTYKDPLNKGLIDVNNAMKVDCSNRDSIQGLNNCLYSS